jgi:hypothetical protein
MLVYQRFNPGPLHGFQSFDGARSPGHRRRAAPADPKRHASKNTISDQGGCLNA